MAMPAESGANTQSERDAGALIGATMRAVVTGAPGAGKSMLLRHAMLSWAARKRSVDGRTRSV